MTYKIAVIDEADSSEVATQTGITAEELINSDFIVDATLGISKSGNS